MAEVTKIAWCDATFNPWVGCSKVSAGCVNCYAERDFDHRRHFAKWGPDGTRVVTSDANWRKPLRWDRDAAASGVRRKVFCASLADVFEDWEGTIAGSHAQTIWVAPEEPRRFVEDSSRKLTPLEKKNIEAGIFKPATMAALRAGLWDLIAETPALDWLLLTKRPENIERMVPDRWYLAWPKNVWIGVTVENQATADERIPQLLRIPAAVRFLSLEPLLSDVNVGPWVAEMEPPGKTMLRRFYGPEGFDATRSQDPTPRYRIKNQGIHWIIAGGESGPGARPSNPDWFRSSRDQCQAAGVPFFFKQWGEWIGGEASAMEDGIFFDDQRGISGALSHSESLRFHDFGLDDNESSAALHVRSKNAGRLLDGREWNEIPIQVGGERSEVGTP